MAGWTMAPCSSILSKRISRRFDTSCCILRLEENRSTITGSRSLGFEESIQAALEDIGGGEMLFQMRVERHDCQRVAAVRIGSGEEQQFALVIMPPGGGLMRVEPVQQNSNPLAPITESYASLMDTFRAAA
jgi:hypothetical protein